MLATAADAVATGPLAGADAADEAASAATVAVGEPELADRVGDAVSAVVGVVGADVAVAEARALEAAEAATVGLAALAGAEAAEATAAVVVAVAVPVFAALAGARAAVVAAATAGVLAGTDGLGELATAPTATAGVRAALAGAELPASAVLSCKRDRSLMFFDNSATRSLAACPWRAVAICASGAAPLTDPLDSVSLSGELAVDFFSSTLGCTTPVACRSAAATGWAGAASASFRRNSLKFALCTERILRASAAGTLPA